MLDIIERLFNTLNEKGIKYCHWKSNESLGEALKGEGDLDILVDRRDVGDFVSLIESMGFKRAMDLKKGGPDSISHYYGMDSVRGSIVHLHVYFKLLTGGALVKNYRLPLEELLLTSAENIDVVKVPSKSAEFALIVLRKVIEHGTFFDTVLFYREYDKICRELKWLGGEDVVEEAASLIEIWLPSVDRRLFISCAKEIMPGGSFFKRLLLGRKLRARLHNYSICGPLKAFLLTGILMIRRVSQKVSGRKTRILARGGVVVAVVGPDAVGKSTMHGELKKWLEDHFLVEAAHVGKPPSTLLTVLPNIIAIFGRKVFYKYRSSRVKKDFAGAGKERKKTVGSFRFLIFAIRSLMVALSRQALIKNTLRKASAGAIVICDRYPSYAQGAMDSSQFEGMEEYFPSSSIGRWIAEREKNIYKSLPMPDVIFSLKLPVKDALVRNLARGGSNIEDDEYFSARHASSTKQKYISGCKYTVDTSAPLENTLSEVKAELWRCL